MTEHIHTHPCIQGLFGTMSTLSQIYYLGTPAENQLAASARVYF